MAEVSLKERFSSLSNLPSFFKLVWKASPSLAVATAVIRIIRSAIPAGILYVGKLIIDQVAAGRRNFLPLTWYAWQTGF